MPVILQLLCGNVHDATITLPLHSSSPKHQSLFFCIIFSQLIATNLFFYNSKNLIEQIVAIM